MDHHDHSHHMAMDHSAHQAHGGHGSDLPGGPMCNMNMLFTWDTNNLCIVFRQWHVTSTLSLLVSLVAVVALTAGYEALREGIRQYEASVSKRTEAVPHSLPTSYHDHDDDVSSNDTVTEYPDPLSPRPPTTTTTGQARDEVARRAHIVKAVLYGIQNFYAFMIMLIFMTYNGWVMIAVSSGASLGYLFFGGRTPAAKDTACH